jgi:hypothetical protein
MKKYFLETWWMRYFMSYKKTTQAIFVSSYTRRSLKNKTTKTCACALSFDIVKSIIVNHEMGHKIDNNEDENASIVAHVYQFYKLHSLVPKKRPLVCREFD